MLTVIGLFVIPLVVRTIEPLGIFSVDILGAIAAGVTIVASGVAYAMTPKDPSTWPSLIGYLLFTVTSGIIVFQTGGVGSPFVALWALTSLLAGLFAVWGWLTIVIAIGGYTAYSYLSGDLDGGTIAMLVFVSIVPLVAGLIAWHGQESTEKQNLPATPKALATQISEVANTSEVVINAIGDGVMAIDSQGIVQLINPAAQALLGWGKQDALLLNYKSILKLVDQTGHDIDDVHDPVAQALNTNQQIRANDLTIVTKSEKKIQGAIVVSPIGEAGSGAIAVFRDVTKEKAEEREQAEFISTAAHEMRTPVASIEGYLGLVMNPATATVDDRARGFIMKAHESAQHLGRLFQDLLDISKSEDGRMNSVPKVVDMTEFTGGIVQGLSAKANEKHLSISYLPTSGSSQQKLAPVYLVNLDNDHIREILDNLIENAIKYTPKGSVTVDVSGDDERVTISVKDTGLGIPAEDIPHLFQKFYRIENADRNDIGGTGLGLYLSRRLAESMGGRIWVESIYGQGSTFYLELPRISSQEAQDIKAQQASQLTIAPASTATPETTVSTEQLVSAAPPVAASQIPQTPVQAPTAAPPSTPEATKPATTVPRGESLSREQIAEHVRRLNEMARGQQRPQEPRQ